MTCLHVYLLTYLNYKYRMHRAPMCDTSHFRREYVLVKATNPAHLTVPPRLFMKRKLGKDPVH